MRMNISFIKLYNKSLEIAFLAVATILAKNVADNYFTYSKLEKLIQSNQLIIVVFFMIIFIQILNEPKGFLFLDKVAVPVITILIFLILQKKSDIGSAFSIYIFILVFFIAFFIMGYLVKFMKNLKRFNYKSLYSSRLKNKETLEWLLTKYDVNSVLIDGAWGTGKTFFVKYFFTEKHYLYRPLWIKTSLFSTKAEVRNFLLQEIKIILADEGLKSFAWKKILRKFEFSIPYISFKADENSLEENFKDFKKFIYQLRRKIIIVLDDLDRIHDVGLKKDIISFISEIEDFTGIKVLILMYKDKSEIDIEFLDKYKDATIKLNELALNIEEVIKGNFEDQIIQEAVNNFIKLFDHKFNYLDLISPTSLLSEEMTSKINLAVKRLSLKESNLIEKIKTPRFMEKFSTYLSEKNIIRKFEDYKNEVDKYIFIQSLMIGYIIKESFVNAKEIFSISGKNFNEEYDNYNIYQMINERVPIESNKKAEREKIIKYVIGQ